MQESRRLLSVRDVMAETGLKRDTVYALMKSPSFPGMRIGRSYYVSVENLDKWNKTNQNRTINLPNSKGGKKNKDGKKK